MRVMGLDIATTTGWCIIEDGKLKEYGTISLDKTMTIQQKLHYFHLELTRLFQNTKPDWCFIEDIIMGMSGFGIAVFLARLNGVAILTAYNNLQQRVKMYKPTYWKSHSIEGVAGGHKKWQIQMAVVKHFNIPVIGNIVQLESIRRDFDNRLKFDTESIESHKNIQYLHKKIITRKKPRVSTPAEITQAQMAVAQEKKIIEELQINKKKLIKDFDKIMMKTTVDVSAQTGITTDIADAICIAICGIKQCNL